MRSLPAAALPVLPMTAQAVQWVAYVTLSPLLAGTLTWAEARLQGRRGAGPAQVYRELATLLRMRPTVADQASVLFPLAPAVAFTTAALIGTALPPVHRPDGPRLDLLLTLGLLTLGRFATTLAAFDASSAMAVLAGGRQWLLHLLVEPCLVLAVYVAAVREALAATGGVQAPVVALVLGALGMALLAETGRMPFDRTGSHLELTLIEEGAGLDHGGPGLALLRWAEAMRLTFAVALLARLATLGATPGGPDAAPAARAVLTFALTATALVAGLAVWEVRTVKIRPRTALTLLTASLGVLLFALVALATATIRGGR